MRRRRHDADADAARDSRAPRTPQDRGMANGTHAAYRVARLGKAHTMSMIQFFTSKIKVSATLGKGSDARTAKAELPPQPFDHDADAAKFAAHVAEDTEYAAKAYDESKRMRSVDTRNGAAGIKRRELLAQLEEDARVVSKRATVIDQKLTPEQIAGMKALGIDVS